MKTIFATAFLLLASVSASANVKFTRIYSCDNVQTEQGAILYDYPSLSLEVAHVPMGPMLPAFSTEVTIISDDFAWTKTTERFATRMVAGRYETENGRYAAILEADEETAKILLLEMPGVKADCKALPRQDMAGVRRATLNVVRETFKGFVTAKVALGEKTLKAVLVPSLRRCVRAPCPQPKVKTVELPIVKVTKTGCGDTYIARRDLRPVDGILEELTLQDFSEIQCRIAIHPDHVTKLEFKTAHSGMGSADTKPIVTSFHGPALK